MSERKKRAGKSVKHVGTASLWSDPTSGGGIFCLPATRSSDLTSVGGTVFWQHVHQTLPQWEEQSVFWQHVHQTLRQWAEQSVFCGAKQGNSLINMYVAQW